MEPPPLTPLAAALLRVPAPERALVVGCGDGEPTLMLAREFPAARVRGVDASAARIREAQARVGLDPEGRVAFKPGKPGGLPYPDSFFDLVAQVGGAVVPAELARVLRHGGHLILVPQSQPRFAFAARERLRRARLARAGFVPLQEEAVSDGKFSVARLDEHRSARRAK